MILIIMNGVRHITAQKMKFSIKDFFIKCDQITFWSHLLKKSLMENFIFYAETVSWTLSSCEVKTGFPNNLVCLVHGVLERD